MPFIVVRPIAFKCISSLTPGGFVLALLCMTSFALAGDTDQYRYDLDRRSTAEVCQHMRVVYNDHFRYPWRRPILAGAANDVEYGPTSPYAFPKLPGIPHDDGATLGMSFSRLPTSAEFDAIEWREARFQGSAPDRVGPALVAEVDINNDGRRELLIKYGFVRSYYSDGGRGGEDYLRILGHHTVQELPNPIRWDTFKALASTDGSATLTASPEFPYRLVRPFRYDGTTYIAAYKQDFRGKRLSEFVDILKYLGGGNPATSGGRNPIQTQRICRLSMHPIPGHR